MNIQFSMKCVALAGAIMMSSVATGCSTVSKTVLGSDRPSAESYSLHNDNLKAYEKRAGYFYRFKNSDPTLPECLQWFRAINRVSFSTSVSKALSAAHHTNYCATKFQPKSGASGSATNRGLEVQELGFKTVRSRQLYDRAVARSQIILARRSEEGVAFALLEAPFVPSGSRVVMHPTRSHSQVAGSVSCPPEITLGHNVTAYEEGC